ncbi:MAG: phage tail sheath family protein [Solirubrobacteraceae bacterium]|nr:phage tail sheath family protein [Solirubrobacteraceae bacterium]
MPTNYLTPGVYVEEVPSTSKPIEGVSTSIAAFVGLAPGGPVNTPMRIANWTQFVKLYGDPVEPENGPFMEGAYLAHAVYGFFNNGGGVCWVVRVGQGADTPTPVAALPSASDEELEAFRVTAVDPEVGDVKIELIETTPPAPSADGDDGDSKPAAKDPVYKIVVSSNGSSEEHDNLTLKKGRANIATRVNAQSKLIHIEETGASLPEAARIPSTGTYTLSVPAIAPSAIEAKDITGDVAKRRGVGGLAAIDEITMVCAPDLWAVAASANGNAQHVIKDVQSQLIAHCENAGDRMAILDAPPELLPQDVLDWRLNTAGYDSKFAALYYPWLEVSDPLTGRPLQIPPCGHMAGVWCRTDATRGVHKAPANEIAIGATGIGFQVTQEEQGALNQNGINCIRTFPGRGIRVWGARTLSSDPEWRYINVRRLFNYVSESIMAGTQWSVFEPNDQKLWIQLRVAATNFLTRTWRSGALFGSTPGQAFYVKCDEETNPPDVIEAGQVVCEIGIAPVKPAEFVVFRLSQYAEGSDVE